MLNAVVDSMLDEIWSRLKTSGPGTGNLDVECYQLRRGHFALRIISMKYSSRVVFGDIDDVEY